MTDRQTFEAMEQKINELSQELAASKQREKMLQDAESYYRAFFEHGPDGVVILNPETLYPIDFNDQVCRQLGYTREEFARLRLSDIEAVESAQEAEAHVKKILKVGFEGFETLHRTKDGEIRSVLVLANVIGVENRRIYHCIWRDITNRKQAEKELLDSEKKYKDLVENIGEIIYSMDLKGILTYINPVCEKIIGYKPEELIGKSVLDIIYEGDWERGKAGYQEVFKEDNTPSEYRLVHKSGSPVWVRSFSRPTVEGGKVIGIHGVVTNIDDLKKSLDENKALEYRLHQSQKMEAIGTLAGGIAHDFNNILSPIIGFTEMILMETGGDDPSLKENLLQILESARRGSDLTRQILSFSRKMEPEIKPLDIKKLMAEVLKLIRPTLPTTIQIEQQMDEGVGYVMADSTQIHQVVMNLITNAYHAMQEDGGLLTLSLEKKALQQSHPLCENLKPGAYVCLQVADTGTGIDKAIIDKIFDPYFTTKDKDKGTGLGLANVLSIVKNHNGHVEVESKPGCGATFRVYLPMLEKLASRKKSEQYTRLPRGDENVLVVDDERNIAQVVRQILDKLGYHAIAKTQSMEALELFKQDPSHFNLVVTDMTMPQMTGAQLAKEILAIRKDIPIILCTGFSDKIDVESAKNIGIKDFLLKPVEINILADTVRKALDEK